MRTLGAQDVLLIYCIALPLITVLVSCIGGGIIVAIKEGLNKDLVIATLGYTACESAKAIGIGMIYCIVVAVLIIIIKFLLKFCGIVLADDRIYVAGYIILDLIRKFMFPQKIEE